MEARFEFRPALRQEVLAETFAGLARDGRVSRRGLPNLLQLAVIAREFEQEGYGTRPPLAVQCAVLGPLAAIGPRRGYRAWYPRYSDPEVAQMTVEESAAERADSTGYVFIDEWEVDAPIRGGLKPYARERSSDAARSLKPADRGAATQLLIGFLGRSGSFHSTRAGNRRRH
ncbi:MAG: hypothetical protein M3N16_01105 [Actinomycetota bacterium]|nr:hypothetical protein [Actinomycetota bacterium]